MHIFEVKFTGKEPVLFKFESWQIAVDTVIQLLGRPDVQRVEIPEHRTPAMQEFRDLVATEMRAERKLPCPACGMPLDGNYCPSCRRTA